MKTHYILDFPASLAALRITRPTGDAQARELPDDEAARLPWRIAILVIAALSLGLWVAIGFAIARVVGALA